MLNKLHTFYLLNWQEKKYFLQAYILLGIMRAAVSSLTFKRLSRSLEHHSEDPPHKPLTTNQRAEAQTIGRAVVTAARFTPWDSNCLAQALTAQRMLKQQHIAGMFFLGVRKDKQDLGAHAWLQCDKHILTGQHEHKTYTVISTYSWL